MTTPSNWRDVKAKARAADPAWDTEERTARRARMREEMLASVSGAQHLGGHLDIVARIGNIHLNIA